jgi:hypothetical protein
MVATVSSGIWGLTIGHKISLVDVLLVEFGITEPLREVAQLWKFSGLLRSIFQHGPDK